MVTESGLVDRGDLHLAECLSASLRSLAIRLLQISLPRLVMVADERLEAEQWKLKYSHNGIIANRDSQLGRGSELSGTNCQPH